MDRLSEIRARCEAATPGPWEAKTNRHPQCNGEPWGWISGATGRITWSGNLGKTNAAFIAHAREDIPYLLAEVERLQGKLQDQEYQILLDAMEQSRDEAIARAEKAEVEQDTYKAALQNWHEQEGAEL